MPDILERLTLSLADSYRIERELGQGGMATVYLAHDIRHDRKVALKILRPELAAILGGERFLHEIRTTANLQHPHILPLHDSGEADGTVFYVMPYVEGESLRDRLQRKKQLPVEDAVRIAKEVASALDYAHRHGVVHRDIKPENILLHDGQALVADFGIALAASRSDGGTRMTETGMSLGTPHYMSPEQAMGEKEITPKADVYALGCVLYEMLTGEPPFNGPTAQAIVARVVTEEPRSLTIQRHTIPAHVEAAVRTALGKLPADRFASAALFAEALARSDYTVPGTHAAPAVRAPARRRLAAAAPWVVAAGALAALALVLLRRDPPAVTRQRVVLWQAPLAAGQLPRWATISPDGNTLVYSDTVGGTRQLWSRERDRLDATALAGTSGIFEVRRTRDTSLLLIRYTTPPSRDIHAFRRGTDSVSQPLIAEAPEEVTPALSPDGRWLAYSSNETGRYEIYVRPFPSVNEGRWQVSGNGGTEPRWAPGGRELFYRGGGSLMAVPVAPGPTFTMGVQRVLFSIENFVPGSNHTVYDVTPDGRRFLFLRGRGGPQVGGGPVQVVQVDHWLTELRRGTRSR